jgi:hypothetical protein
MPWEPETFTPEQRYAAAKAIVHAQILVYRMRLQPAQFGPEHAAAVESAYLQVEDFLSMIHEDLYGLDGVEPQV